MLRELQGETSFSGTVSLVPSKPCRILPFTENPDANVCKEEKTVIEKRMDRCLPRPKPCRIHHLCRYQHCSLQCIELEGLYWADCRQVFAFMQTIVPKAQQPSKQELRPARIEGVEIGVWQKLDAQGTRHVFPSQQFATVGCTAAATCRFPCAVGCCCSVLECCWSTTCRSPHRPQSAVNRCCRYRTVEPKGNTPFDSKG